MTMAQTWTIIGMLAAAVTSMIVMMQRSMSLHGKSLTDAMDRLGTGLRNEMKLGLDGLRNEMIARFEHVEREVERQGQRITSLDREVHALMLRVFKQPPENP